jgi:FkbM family methyltransferase
MLCYAVAQNKEPILDTFYRIRGAIHGYSRGQLRIAKYNGLMITFPFNEDPAFDDVWIRDVYQEYTPKKDDVVIDVGAHMGFFTLKIVNDVKQIIAVEPDPVNFKFLKYNAALNGVEDRVVLCNIALGRENGRIFLDRSSYGYGRSKSTTEKTNYSSEMLTLDTLVKEKMLSSVNLVKIDTEGFEPDVLEGAAETLGKYRPDLIIAAYHFPKEYSMLAHFLENRGYSVFFYCMPLFLFGGKEVYLYARANHCKKKTGSSH